MEKAIRLSAYAVVVEEGAILLCRLSATSNDPGMWTLPGGGGNYGESPEETCVREVREETGFDVELIGRPFVESKLWERPTRQLHSVRLYYLARRTGGVLTHETDESTDLAAWVPLSEVPGLVRADVIETALREFVEEG